MTEASRYRPESVVIVGAGHGGANAAALLRQHGYEGNVTLLSGEATPPYQRPPLSKDFLKGVQSTEQLLIKPESFYAEQGIDLRLDTPAASIDTDPRQVRLADSHAVNYDALILATGATARQIGVPGAHLEGICELRALPDAERLARRVRPGTKVVIVGGGYIGLEVAASVQHLGGEVVVLEREGRVLPRVASLQLAAWLTARHRQLGTIIVTSADVAEFVDGGDRAVAGVRLADGREYPCDLALVGVGAVPCDALARDAGLACDGGIVVDELGCTSDPFVFAVGDVTRRPLHHYAGRHRMESIPSAIEQAKQVVSVIVGQPAPKPEVPWFWSDQFDIRLKIAGLVQAADTVVVRGDQGSGKFGIFHLRSGRVVAVETVNSGPDFMAGKHLIERASAVDPARLGDVSVSLRELAA